MSGVHSTRPGVPLQLNFYTREAFLCHIEGIFRQWLKTFKLPSFEIVRIPALITPEGFVLHPAHIRLSIASDTSNIIFNGSGATLSSNFTIATLTNGLMLVGNLHNSGDHLTATSWNSVASTQQTKANTRGGLEAYIWYLLAPTPGTNSLVSTSDGTSGEVDHAFATYSGVAQSGFPDSSFSDLATNASSNTFSLTTVANNAWAFIVYTPNNGPSSAGTNATKLQDDLPSGDMAIFDNSGHGAITPAGSFSMTCSASGATQSRGIGVSFAPFVALTTRTLTALGVG
jgi:hypothetical protein